MTTSRNSFRLSIAVGVTIAAVAVLISTLMFEYDGDGPLAAHSLHSSGSRADALGLASLREETKRSDRENVILTAPGEAVVAYEPTTTIVVLDEQGQAVPSADVWLVSESGTSWLGASNAAGKIHVSARKPASGKLQASQNGKYGIAHFIDGSLITVIELRLIEANELRGIVRHINGDPVGAGYQVMAWNSGLRFPDRSLAQQSASGDPDLPMAETAKDGSFLLSGLDPRASYDLIAGGPGHLSRILRSVPIQSAPLELSVAPAYALHVHPTDEFGRDISRGTALARGFQMTIFGDSRDASITKLPEFACLLAGAIDTKLPLAPYSTLMTVTSESTTTAVGPYHVSASIPGYYPIRESIFLPRLSGIVPEHQLVLRKRPEATGEFMVRLIGASSANDASARSRTNGDCTVTLSSELGRQHFPVASLGDTEQSFQGVRVGTYAVSATSTSCGASLSISSPDPPILTLTQSGAPPVIEIKIAELGWIEALIRDKRGFEYNGPAAFTVGHRSSTVQTSRSEWEWTEIDFEHPPYRIAGLVSGEYYVGVRDPDARRIAGQSGPASVAAGTGTEMSFVFE